MEKNDDTEEEYSRGGGISTYGPACEVEGGNGIAEGEVKLLEVDVVADSLLKKSSNFHLIEVSKKMLLILGFTRGSLSINRGRANRE